MILRVPDYYEKFACIASKCKDSCCVGWEIDIDEDSACYYKSIKGAFGDRLRENLCENGDDEHGFTLTERGRCPLLNDKNLCDICIELGEQALSEVCTEYPRCSTAYLDVLQKCLSLSCEEVGRIVFSKKDPIYLKDIGKDDELYSQIKDVIDESGSDCRQHDYQEDYYEEDDFEDEEFEADDFEADDFEDFVEYEESDEAECVYVGFDDDDDDEEDIDWIKAVETLQYDLIKMLTNRDINVWDRAKALINMAEAFEDDDKDDDDYEIPSTDYDSIDANIRYLYKDFEERMAIFENMIPINEEWINTKDSMKSEFTEDNYSNKLDDYMRSDSYDQVYFEHLLVYFITRYFMKAAYDYNVASYAKQAVMCTIVIRDITAFRFSHLKDEKREEEITDFDKMMLVADASRIYSKEMEHSEENYEELRECFLFDDVFKDERIFGQI